MIREQRKEQRELIEIKPVEKKTWTNYIKQEYNKAEQNIGSQTPDITEETKTIIQSRDVEEATINKKTAKLMEKTAYTGCQLNDVINFRV